MAASVMAGQQIEMMGAAAKPRRRTESVAERNQRAAGGPAQGTSWTDA